MSVQPNKAIVGANAFRHQSGIHQHGITKLRETYEIIDARDIGLSRGGMIVLNKNSGRHGLKSRLDELGYEITSDEMDRVFVAFKDLADKKGEIDDRDLDALVSEERRTVEDVYKLDLLQVSCGNHLVPTAGRTFVGRAADTDIVVASAKALLNALNRLLAHMPREQQEVWANP